MPKPVLVFDMDGVLVDVTGSYRATIARTVEYFTGVRVAPARIQDYKNQGGWNNDWALARKICADLGVDVDYETVVAQFQEFFLGGNGREGLIRQERWIPDDDLLERLAGSYRLAIFTGRPRAEALMTLDRFAPRVVFDPLVGEEDVDQGKPNPEGLEKIAAREPGAALWYVGDALDDARSARAAGVPFIGIADAANPRAGELRDLLQEEGARAVIDNINRIEGVLPR